jgi:hypothetical protein
VAQSAEGRQEGGAVGRRPASRAPLLQSAGPLFFQSTTLRLARFAAAALTASVAVVGATGCGGAHPRPAALRLERADLALLARTLQRLRAPAAGEVAAARAVWPALAGGLPRGFAPAMRQQAAAAERHAATLALPAVVTAEGSLTGPAAKLAGMLKAYVRLTQRGWQYIAAALAAQSAAAAQGGGASRAAGGTASTLAAAQFLHANAGLYIYCVYDGHYDVSLIGKTLQGAYRTLGGAPAFGSSLTQARVEALAGAYSIPSTRLQPHPPPSVVV